MNPVLASFLIWLASSWPLVVLLPVAVGSYGFYKHATKHTDGTDDIQTADSGQKGLMSSAHVTKLVTIETNAKDDQNAAEVPIADAGEYFESSHVEGALQELGAGGIGEWTDWTPTLTGNATLSGYDYARYYQIGNICFFHFVAENKNVTNAGAAVQITLPFTLASTGDIPPSAMIYDGAAWVAQTLCYAINGSNYFNVHKDVVGGAWAGTETGVIIRVRGFFEIA